MAIDITILDEDELLPTLGEGDWAIVLPTGYPELVVTAEWREALRMKIGIRYVHWVNGGFYLEITYLYDPPWDASGELVPRNASQESMRGMYGTLAEWFENACTGDWNATYQSGYGKYWCTYRGEVEQTISDAVYLMTDVTHQMHQVAVLKAT